MKVIVGVWMTDMGDTFNTSVYDADLKPEDILDSVAYSRAIKGHRVISQTNNYVVFSDGARLLLNLYPVINRLGPIAHPLMEIEE